MENKSWVPANPAPLGLIGFGITTLVLSLVNSNLVGGASLTVVLGLALAYGGLAQLLAGMWEFRTGNTFGAVAFTSYGAFWISFYTLVTFMLFVASFKQPLAVTFVFFALTITFILLGIGWSGATVAQIAANSNSTIHIGGFAGIVTAAAALYASCAMICHHQYGRWVLPVGAKS